MSPEAQRIAIAEACGLKIHSSALQVPDYLNDLNAMHEAEKTLSGIALASYCEQLQRGRHWTTWSDNFPAIHATASQRAEAFLKTKGLWTD